MGWGSQQKLPVKNVFDMENIEDLSKYLQFVIVKIYRGKCFKTYSKALVNSDELNFLWGYGENPDAHISVVNILIKLTTLIYIYLRIFELKMDEKNELVDFHRVFQLILSSLNS